MPPTHRVDQLVSELVTDIDTVGRVDQVRVDAVVDTDSAVRVDRVFVEVVVGGVGGGWGVGFIRMGAN